MQFMDSTWQTCPSPHELAGLGIQPKESKLKLSLETRYRGDVVIVYCQGRIVYRDEAVALSSLVGEVLEKQQERSFSISAVSAPSIVLASANWYCSAYLGSVQEMQT